MNLRNHMIQDVGYANRMRNALIAPTTTVSNQKSAKTGNKDQFNAITP